MRPELPLIADGSAGEVFELLRLRHDRNGDGQIDRDEAETGELAFDRLDRDGDGVLTPADFARQGRRPRGLGFAEAVRQRGVHLLAWYFQDGARNHEVSIDEVRIAFEDYDANGDGRIGRSEFERRATVWKERGRIPAGRWSGVVELETTDPWERLVLAIDRDGDSFLTMPEIDRFHTEIEQGSGWVLDAPETAVPIADLTGRRAPDFTLGTLDGQETVTLSSFAGNKPVALIFGSYT